ncbi:MAG TPA: nuclear transport factor 2 family protein [Vicinamibacteria bacterium]|nr:nuclear transport factor 2 family protein [Vicinamibacteria bacterium]
MKKGTTHLCLLIALTVPAAAGAEPPPPAAAELRALLDEFLAGASRSDAAVHARFWAEDLVYTASSGRRFGRAELLADVRSAPAPKPGQGTTYTSEDVLVRQYGDTAVVTFRLVATTNGEKGLETARYLNSGTFVRRDGRWQAVNWQATKVPAEDDVSGPRPSPQPKR